MDKGDLDTHLDHRHRLLLFETF